MWNSLDSEVNFRFRLSLVRHGSLRAGSALRRIFALNLPGILQNKFKVVDVVMRKLSDTESLQFWYSPLVQDSRLVQSREGGSTLPECESFI